MNTLLQRPNELHKKHTTEALGMSVKGQLNKYQVHNNEVYEIRAVHSFTMGDVEDPEIYMAQPIYEWQQTEKGKWVMKHGLDPTYHLNADYSSYGYKVTITAGITAKRWTEYVLRGWYNG